MPRIDASLHSNATRRNVSRTRNLENMACGREGGIAGDFSTFPVDF
jgi:hypothetical protein